MCFYCQRLTLAVRTPARKANMNDSLLTFGPASIKLGCQPHHLDKLARGKKIPHQVAGRFRVVRVADFPKIRKALIAAGYLKETEPAAAAL